MTIDGMIQSVRNALGWPYVSPGSNDSSGIDCSGLFVRMYRDQGEDIAHGSNSIFRKYCSETGKIQTLDQLAPGMAVFKLKEWTKADEKNRYYGSQPGNLSHIGLVVSVNPLEIIHASTETMCVKTDTKIGKWAYWGKLKAVDYSGAEMKEIMKASVWADSGDTVNMRQKADIHSPLTMRIPIGEEVTVDNFGKEWSAVSYSGKKGYVMTRFLTVDEVYNQPEEKDEGESIRISRKALEAIYDEIGDMLGLRG